ncbi:unnamed protein product, partial [Ranitomeya imitator]
LPALTVSAPAGCKAEHSGDITAVLCFTAGRTLTQCGKLTPGDRHWNCPPSGSSITPMDLCPPMIGSEKRILRLAAFSLCTVYKTAAPSKMAELEKRLGELEAAVRFDQDTQDTVEILQAKVNMLDVASLDQVEARLQSVLGKMNEIAKHKAAVEDADTESKVHQLYDIVQKWDSMSGTLPQVVQRLVTLKQLHEQGNIRALSTALQNAVDKPLMPSQISSQYDDHNVFVKYLIFSYLVQAMQFGQLLTHLDTTQLMISNSLKDNTAALAVVRNPFFLPSCLLSFQ